jgi:hypothetical protein
MTQPPNWELASGALVGTMGPSPQLFAGEAPIVTDSAPALAAIQKWQLCELTPTGVKAFVSTGTPATDSTANSAVIAAVGVSIGQQCPYYHAGKFNHEAMVWPAALDTLAKRKVALHGSMILIGHLVG